MFSLLTKLFFAGILISVLPLIISQYINFSEGSKTLQMTYSKELKHKTELTTLLINQAISHRISDLDIIANGISQWLKIKKHEVIKKQFERLESTRFDISSINLVDLDGNFLISTISDNIYKEKISIELKKFLREYKISNVQEPFLSELIFYDNETYIYLAKKVSGFDNFVVLEVNMQNIELLLSSFDDEVTGEKPVYVVDKQNNIIITTGIFEKIKTDCSNVKKMDSKNELENGIYYFEDCKGEEVIATYDEVHEFGVNKALGWKVVASIPTSVINENVDNYMQMNKYVCFIIILITFFILTILSRHFAKSINKVVNIANKISNGDYTSRALEKNTTTEFNTLSLAINDMAEKIQTRTTKLEEQTELLENLAHFDTLTNIPNRVLFKDRIEQAIVKAERNNDKFALFYIDLDEFKHINDSFGHDIGDEVLKVVVTRIDTIIREEDTFARLGGDEFTIILEELHNENAAVLVAEKIIKVIKDPIVIEENVFKVSTSIGISIYPKDAKDKSNLIKYADIAMYKAKGAGKDNYQFYSQEMSNYSLKRIQMKQKLDFAIENNEFEVYYQPQVNAMTKELIGMEALIRWNHNNEGFIAPIEFLPLAEEIGLIVDIDRYVMQTAMTQMATWRNKGYNPGVLALNLSLKHLHHHTFISTVKQSLGSAGCMGEWIEFEVTESQIMNNYEEAISKLQEINKLGIRISIDDFGTGYSSLSHLKHLPIDKLKIDKSFVDDITQNQEDAAITKAIIALCKSLNLNVLAEGVETSEQSKFLIENGCSNIQGYLYGKPQSEEDFEEHFLKV